MSTQQITDLAIQIKGEIISSNFEAFKAQALAKIEGMKYELLTDDDFTKAKGDIKDLEVTGKALKGAKMEVLKQLDDVYALMGGIDEIIDAADKCRLEKSREVKKRDAEIRLKIVEDAMELIDHPKRERFRAQVADGAKGKRTFETMGKGANSVAEAINSGILMSRDVLERFSDEHGKLLIPDRIDLELQAYEAVGTELNHRLEKKRDEEEKERLKAESEKLRKEAEAKAQAEREAEEARRETTLPEREIENSRPAEESPFAPAPVRHGAPTTQRVKEETAENEMAAFLATLTSAFAPVKTARGNLRFPENIERAAAFAEGLATAYKALKSHAQS